MRNLFVCHSQAQLLLAISLSTGRFTQDQNDLILFTDFKLKDELRKCLDSVFTRVLIRVGTFPSTNKSWKEKFKRYPVDLKEIRKFVSLPFDKVFEVCDDCIPELFILKYTYKKNPNTEYIWLEDGSYPYFRNTIDVSGFSTNKTTRTIRKILLKYLCRLGRFYDFKGNYMGANHLLQKAYLTFPGKQRKEYNSKEIIGITNKEFDYGLAIMYPPLRENQLPPNSVLIVMDKLDVYRDLNKIEQSIKQVVTICKQKGKQVFYKYHPREESQLNALQDCNELSRYTGVENFYSANIGNHLTIIGIKSTGLQNAQKLGFKVFSLSPAVGESDANITFFYKNIGITIIKDINEFV